MINYANKCHEINAKNRFHSGKKKGRKCFFFKNILHNGIEVLKNYSNKNTYFYCHKNKFVEVE